MRLLSALLLSSILTLGASTIPTTLPLLNTSSTLVVNSLNSTTPQPTLNVTQRGNSFAWLLPSPSTALGITLLCGLGIGAYKLYPMLKQWLQEACATPFFLLDLFFKQPDQKEKLNKVNQDKKSVFEKIRKQNLLTPLTGPRVKKKNFKKKRNQTHTEDNPSQTTIIFPSQIPTKDLAKTFGGFGQKPKKQLPPAQSLYNKMANASTQVQMQQALQLTTKDILEEALAMENDDGKTLTKLFADNKSKSLLQEIQQKKKELGIN